MKEQQIPLQNKILRTFWQEKPEISLKKLIILMKTIASFGMIFPYIMKQRNLISLWITSLDYNLIILWIKE